MSISLTRSQDGLGSTVCAALTRWLHVDLFRLHCDWARDTHVASDSLCM